MILGVVNHNLEAIIWLKVTGPSGHSHTIEAIVDSGFTDYLTLPPEIIFSLGLVLTGSELVTLAGGSKIEVDIYLGLVLWDDLTKEIAIISAEGSPLVGMSLLAGCELCIVAQPGGPITIEVLP